MGPGPLSDTSQDSEVALPARKLRSPFQQCPQITVQRHQQCLPSVASKTPQSVPAPRGVVASLPAWPDGPSYEAAALLC